MKNQKNQIQLRNPDKVVEEKFSASYMNNTKWKKLLDNLTENLGNIYLYYKLIYSDDVKGYLFDSADFEPFFLEPILYKEIEWIEIPSSFENWVNENNRKAGLKSYLQNIDKIKTEIDKIGEFELNVDEDRIRLYSYR